MKIEPTALDGVNRICIEPHADERGYFARTFCGERLAEAGLEIRFPQHSLSFNNVAGTLRGMHWQAAPHSEIKIVRCTRGRVWDVAVDIRPDSATYGQWVAEELSATNGTALYIPQGCAHGFLTLAPDSELLYYISEPYDPALARGFRYDDATAGIAWPVVPAVISERDRTLPRLESP